MSGSKARGPAGRPPANPYVGPRPLETGERLFGRERELTELNYLLSAERVVLLHSPSGAGKSSLVQAGLIPRLRERFDVWRPTRVGHPLPDGVPDGTNRYVLSAALGFEQGIPERVRRPAAELAPLRLAEYVAQRPKRPSAPENILLIFDQFEEVLTADALAIAAKHAFFAQLGELLQNPLIWALFLLREEYVAPLDPYVAKVPTHLRNRYRINLLDLDAARAAITQPTKDTPRTWTSPAVEQLVNDLALVNAQQPDGSFVQQQGLYVEPMQLQVVCRGLWDRMPADDLSIDPQSVAQFGSVTLALSTYYAGELSRIAGGDERKERALREWIGEKLITADGIRCPILLTSSGSEGLANTLILPLLDSHLVRADKRGGATFFELAHDRLIEPVRRNNEAWFAQKLSLVQQQAKLWESGRRSQALLLGAEALAGAVAWVEKNAGLVTPGEKEFLELSRKRQEDEARQQQRQRAFMAALAVVAIAAMGMGGWAWKNQRQAMTETKRAQESEIAAHQSEAKARDAQESAVLAQAAQAQAATKEKEALNLKMEAILKLDAAQKAAAEQARTVLIIESARDLLAVREGGLAAIVLDAVKQPETAGWKSLANETLSQQIPKSTLRHGAGIRHAAWSPDGRRIVTASDDGTARIWKADGRGDALVLSGHTERINFAEWSPDGKRIVTASNDGTARIWKADGSGSPLVLKGHTEAINSAAWSPDGNHIVTASWDETARVWEVDGSGKSVVLQGGQRVVCSAVWSHDAKRILTASWDGTARVWNADGTGTSTVLAGHALAVNSAAWSPDDKRIVTASDDGTARVWNADGKGKPLVLGGHTGGVNLAAWSHDGKRVVTASSDWTARVWTSDGQSGPSIIQGHKGAVLTASWSANDQRIVTASEDGTVIISEPDGMRDPIHLQGHQRAVLVAAWNPDFKRLVTASADNSARVWNVPQSQEDAASSLLKEDVKADLTIPQLKQRLRNATTDCLLPAQRLKIFLESWPEAHTHFEECQRDHARIRADRDGDGVADADDRCPDAPVGPHPDPNRPGCSADTDGDGVLDQVDQCLMVPAGPHPHPKRLGCPDTDIDGDGVYDSFDRCLMVPAGFRPDPKRPGCPDEDTDGDGVYDSVDQCPTVPAGRHLDPKRPGCPDMDTDGDGVYDSVDQCPMVPAGPHLDPKRPGCPDQDTDGDGVYDLDDQCPNVPAGLHPDPQRPGCPDKDTDGDGVYDKADWCPNVPPGSHPDPQRLGCPDKDTDGDGIYDAFDPCPTVRAGADPNPRRPGCPLDLHGDRDGDGVPDAEDLCPDVPAGPGHPDLLHRGCPGRDRDGDGLEDLLDRCPDEPGPPQSDGCPLDTDKDGIPDKDDKCPYEPGPKTNLGCPPPRRYINVTQEKIEFDNRKIAFVPNKEAVLPSSHNRLQELAWMLREMPPMVLLIEGHTADTGDLAHDMWLSNRRARSVLRYLVEKGVSGERLAARGYGPKRPIASNRTPEGRQNNSRVEFVFEHQ